MDRLESYLEFQPEVNIRETHLSKQRVYLGVEGNYSLDTCAMEDHRYIHGGGGKEETFKDKNKKFM